MGNGVQDSEVLEGSGEEFAVHHVGYKVGGKGCGVGVGWFICIGSCGGLLHQLKGGFLLNTLGDLNLLFCP